MNGDPPHPGEFIRTEVFPKNLTVTEAAKILDMGRPALSNMLNGKSALSPQLASKIESAFGGVTAKELLELQVQYDAARLKKDRKLAPKSYVAPFLGLRANEIVTWATENLSARERLPVLIRVLVNSTGRDLERVDFPGNDDSQRQGKDGFVQVQSATPWIPKGESIWEFGVNKNPKKKADQDFEARIDPSTKAKRLNQTFVFVTPQRWHGKSEWAEAMRARKEWEDVRAYDACDIEQWLEQSISAQAWFAHEQGIVTQGVQSIEPCWDIWIANCDPLPVPELFDQYTQAARRMLSGAFHDTEPRTLLLAADSTSEALAFLSCALSTADQKLAEIRDSCLVFSEKGPLSRLAVRKPGFIAIIANRDVEKELGELKTPINSIVIRPRGSGNFKSDFRLGTISTEFFRVALRKMGCNSDVIEKYSRESGRSATVLRRRLSKLEAVKLPPWADSPKISDLIIPILFAGSWDSQNKADQAVLQILGDGKESVSYPDIEREFGKLYSIDESPVWVSGAIKGIVSKIDLLFAIQNRIVEADLERFFDVAKNLVLSEKDPSLDLPEEIQWMAGVYGKVREISPILRKGITETLVLLAVHGNDLFRARLGIDVKQRIEEMVRSLLVPLTARKLEECSHIFPMLAEAAPEVVIELLENDLNSEESEALLLLRPAPSGIFGRCPRTGLLWALESLAWNPVYLTRVVPILGRLSTRSLDDNWANKPVNSLKAIFRAWMPQTEATITQRILALNLLIKVEPEVGWKVCVEQFDGRSNLGHYSFKPSWRNDGNGFGEPVSEVEHSEFVQHCLDLALQWEDQNVKTLGDLVERHSWVPEEDQKKIWGLIEEWAKDANDEEKCELRERIRTYALTRRARKQSKRRRNIRSPNRARRVFDILLPSDPVLRHKWLFTRHWVDESMDDLDDDDFDYAGHEERIGNLRRSALSEINELLGMEGILRMAEIGDTSEMIGRLLGYVLGDDEEVISRVRGIMGSSDFETSEKRMLVVLGALDRYPVDNQIDFLTSFFGKLTDAEIWRALPCLPFSPITWDMIEGFGKDISTVYWKKVVPRWMFKSKDNNEQAIKKLIENGRPKAAFYMVHHQVEEVSPKVLVNLLKAIPRSSESVDEYQIDSYAIAQAFEYLNSCEGLASSELAELEFLYIEILEREDHPIPNLERLIASDGEFLVQMIVMAYKRTDDGEDPDELKLEDPQERKDRARAAHHLIENISGLPFRDSRGEMREAGLLEWVKRVKSGCRHFARSGVGESILGQLFAKSEIGEDGIWPGEIERNVLENVITRRMEDGILMGLYNQRGVHFRDRGGNQERALAAKYEGWAVALEFTHPQTGKVLRKMAETYRREAEEQDERQEVDDRFRH